MLAQVVVVGVTFLFVGVFVGTFCQSAISTEGVSIPCRGTELPTPAPAKEKPGTWAGSGKLSGFNWFTCFCGPSTSPAQRGELPLVGCALGEPTGGGAGAGRGGAASYHTTPLGNITQQSVSAARITRSGKAPGEPNVGGGAGPWHTGASAATRPAGMVAVVLPWASWPCARGWAVGCEHRQPVCGPAPAICRSAWRSCAGSSRVPDLP